MSRTVGTCGPRGTAAGLCAALLAVLWMVNPVAASAPAAVRTVRVPDGGIHPQAAVDAKGRVHLVYFKGEATAGDAFYVRSDDGGATFAKPLRVNSQPGSVIVAGTVRGPHLALGRGDRPHVAWMGSGKAEPRLGKQAPMLYARLGDAGDGFEPQRNVMTTRRGLDGGGSVAADADGNVYVAWHAPTDYPPADGERDRRVWVARSTDDGKSFGAEAAVDPVPLGVCACCGMRAFAAGKGRVMILYRSAREMTSRDVQFLVSADGGRTFATAATDPWAIGRCVMSTFAAARGPNGDVWAAWETRDQIRLARLTAEGVKVTEPVDVPGNGPNRKHPSLAANGKGEWLVAWTEGTAWNRGGSVVWRLYKADGSPAGDVAGREQGLPAWGVPAAVALPDGTFVVIY